MSQSRVAIAYVLLSIMALAGLSMGPIPLVVDFPNHAARLFVACNIGNPVFSRMYEVDYSLIPNLAIDVLHKPFCGLIDPMPFLRGTLAVTMAGILLIVWKLHSLLNDRPNGFVLIAPAMSFNLVTSMGYLNFLIGTLLFLVFAWIMWRFDVLRRHPALAIAVPNVVGIMVYFCHVFALALVGVFLFGLRFAFERDHPLIRRTLRSATYSAAAFAIPLLMMLLTERSGGEIAFASIDKLRTVLAPFLYGDGKLAAALLCVWVMVLCFAALTKRLRIAEQVRTPLLFLLLYVVLLPRVVLDAVDIDSRSLVSITLLAVAGLGMCRENGRFLSAAKLEILIGLAATATILVQMFNLAPKVRQLGLATAELRDALTTIEPNSAVLSMQDKSRAPPIAKMFYWHLGSYMTSDRGAFNPLEFTGKGMQPLHAAAAFDCIDVPVGVPLSREAATNLLRAETAAMLRREKNRRYGYAHHWDRRFDYVLYYHFGGADNPFPRLLTPVRQGSYFTLFRIRAQT